MNKHIKQFERASGIEVYGLGLDRAKWESRLEVYTQLIVQECADVANAGIDSAESHLPGDDILEHFGVNE